MKQNYFIGLDIGTDSVGWAVTDESYNVLSYKSKAMWGSRLFDAANTAEERRLFRANRRRLERKKQRICWLQDLFAPEIAKVDENFFLKMKESSLWLEDKQLDCEFSLFNDKDYTDRDYHREFPTIYHLRTALLENKKEYDVRLVYLAIHNILKHRGHFLFESNMESITSFRGVYQELVACLEDEFDIILECSSIQEMESILRSKKLGIVKKKAALTQLFGINRDDKQLCAIIGLIAGKKEKLQEIFFDESLLDIEISSIAFSGASYEEERIILEDVLIERAVLLDKLKAVYDWAILAEILEGGTLNGKQYLSVSKVRVYEKHKKDLLILKQVVKDFCPNKYKDIFKNYEDNISNYAAYVGVHKEKGKSTYIKKCKKDEFYKYITDVLSTLHVSDERIAYLLCEKDAGTLLPLQVNGDNGVIPNQVHKIELIEILENASAYLPFLLEKDNSGISIKEKIVRIFEFRVPYYVGPLNAAHMGKGANCWIVRKEEGQIYPWNFEQKVDMDSSGEVFISRMTNSCTYLLGEKVLPKNSLLYREFMVWNELNNVRIRDEKLPVSLKQKFFTDVFKTHKKVKGKSLLEYLKKEGYEVTKEELTGFDQDFQSSLNSYCDFKKILGDAIDKDSVKEMVEQIIFWMTIYSDGGKILKRKIREAYGTVLSEEEIKKICRLKYSGWGNLSREFLCEIVGAPRGMDECCSIILALREGNDNLMQLLSQQYTYGEEIEATNRKLHKTVKTVSYEELIKDLYVSPSVKRSIWQTVQITEEIRKIMKCEPTKIFVEMARSEGEKIATVSRKNQLLELYRAIRQDEHEGINRLTAEIENTEESVFQNQKIYLYYTQLGHCMYSGETISITELNNANTYDRDHIYPQSKTKDDSIINNLVLVKKNINKEKNADIVPLDIQKKMEPTWRFLRNRKLISEEKYKRLTRKTPLTDEELAGFINRQLVETRQSSKAVATLLNNLYESTEIVYVKAGPVSDFKRDNEMLKVRELNDYHHGKDAYLNIVVGNVYNTKFTQNPLRWIKDNPSKNYSLNCMFNYDLYKGEQPVWVRGKEGTIKLVMKIYCQNNLQFTRYSYCENGGMFNQQIVRAGKGKVAIKGNQYTDLAKYGGYDSVKNAYFMLVESVKKETLRRTIENVPVYLQHKFETDNKFALEYCRNTLGLEEPRIIIPKIKKKAKIVVDGFPMHITGSNGIQLGLQVAAQLILPKESEKYLKKVYKYLEKNSKRRDKRTLLKISDYDNITLDENISLYDVLYNKHKDSIYAKRLAGCINTLQDGRDKFKTLSLEEQCIVIGEIMHLFQCKPVLADLTLIGGIKSGGKIQPSKDITKLSSVKLINQSPTGLFQQEINLLKV